MDVSHFLAKVMGIYFFLAGLLLVFRHNYIREVVNDYFDSPALMMYGGAINLIFGLLVVLSHNVWEMNWQIIITLVGCLMLLKGIMHWFFPEAASSLSTKVAQGSAFVYLSIVIMLLGIYLTYIGYFV